jgi:O-antigen/teichoic acid export membrane protein
VAAIGFIRSFYIGTILDFVDLGYITLIQTGAMIVGFLHFGLLSGGFRALAMREKSDFHVINNTIVTFFLLLLLVLGGVIVIGYLFNLYSQFVVVSFALLIGFFSLLVSWITAVQFSNSRYLHNNLYNLISSLLSLLLLFVWPKTNIITASIAILTQPVLFLVLSANYFKNFYFSFRYDILSGIFKIGFVTYLTTVLGLLYTQIERWTINAYLGVETLGQLYLLFIIVTLWNLVPASISNLFFPAASRAFEEKKMPVFRSAIKKNLLILCGYSMIMILCILFLLKPVTALLFKLHLPFIKYVYWAMPGLVLKTVSEGFYLILTTTLKLKPIFKLDILSIIFYSMCVGLLIGAGTVTLVNLIICFNLYCLFRFIYLFVAYKSQINFISKSF